MPNARRNGWRVASFSAPTDLVAAAQEKARKEGRTLSEVIRSALVEFTGSGSTPPRG